MELLENRVSSSTLQAPDAVAESVEHGSRVQEIVHSNPWSSQTNDLSNLYLLIPS